MVIYEESRSPRLLNFVPCRTIFVGPDYGTCFMSPFWPLEFLDCYWIFAKSAQSCSVSVLQLVTYKQAFGGKNYKLHS